MQILIQMESSIVKVKLPTGGVTTGMRGIFSKMVKNIMAMEQMQMEKDILQMGNMLTEYMVVSYTKMEQNQKAEYM